MTRAPYSYRDDPDVPDFPDDKPLFVFDGHCVLCSRWTDILIKHDKDRRYRLTSAQSPLGEALYAHYGYKSGDYDTNMLIEGGVVRVKSDGTLALMKDLGFPFSILNLFRVLPESGRDWGYEFIARNRLKWFGARQVCYVPSPEDKDRFL